MEGIGHRSPVKLLKPVDPGEPQKINHTEDTKMGSHLKYGKEDNWTDNSQVKVSEFGSLPLLFKRRECVRTCHTRIKIHIPILHLSGSRQKAKIQETIKNLSRR